MRVIVCTLKYFIINPGYFFKLLLIKGPISAENLSISVKNCTFPKSERSVPASSNLLMPYANNKGADQPAHPLPR